MGRAFEYRRAAKEKRWDKMSKIFPKLSKAITVAAKEGGIDPDTNAKLRTAIQNAKAENMPKDNIENAIQRATEKSFLDMTQVTYEGKGPHGVLIIVECATDNMARTIANVKSYFSKAGGGFVPSGSLEFMFGKKAVFEFEPPQMDKEELELTLIDGGLESIEEHEGMYYIYTDYTHFGVMSQLLEEIRIPIKKSTLKRIPVSPVSFSEEQLLAIEKMLDKIEGDDDVQAVYTNIL